jgi:transcription elongation factor SPT5
LRATEGDLKDQLVEVPVRNLRKRFRDGDNVVVGGASKYRDQVGTVIAIENDKVTILSHDNQMEFTVFSKDLRIASGAGASTERSPYEVRDLVQLTATTFGCVVAADPQTVKVMDQNGSIETRLPSSLSKIVQSRNVVAVDKNGSEIRPGDTVKESGGEGKSGNILHIYRNYLFAHDRSRMTENAGIWVARASNVIGRSSRNGGLTDLTKMNPALQVKAPNGAPMGPPQRPGIDRLIRKRIKITRGPYKGHRGTVRDATLHEARIELESKNKTVNIPKSDISVFEYVKPFHCEPPLTIHRLHSDTATPYAQWAGAGRRPGGAPGAMRTGPGIPGSRVPDGARTPAAALGDGGRTPGWGNAARTPAWGGPSANTSALDSGRTPSWRAAPGSQTSYGGAGNNTTYGGTGNFTAGSRTPAWSSAAKTPYGADHGGYGSSGGSSFDAFAAGSRTPAYSGASSSRTPAWSGAAATAPTPAARPYDAPTPAMNAPTPGAGYNDDGYTPAYSAPTPGAGFGSGADAPTPGFARAANTVPLKNNRLTAPAGPMDAPTPAAGGPVSAPTPAAWGGAYDAPTPAVGGGPQYVDDDDD